MWNNRVRLIQLSSSVRMCQSVSECYKGKSVFITGGTGFLGKVLLEKLLYSCPGIDKIYLLIREKQGTSCQRRIEEALENPLFSRVKEQNSQILNKIIPIAGNLTEPRLGLHAKDANLLIDKVSYVFHAAASVNFDDCLKDAMDINLSGTSRVLNLAKEMQNIKAFIHISTAYTNTGRKVIKEHVYPPSVSIDEVKKLLAKGLSEEQLGITLGYRPNTYTFTKALGENLVADNHGSVPAVIVRPSIVSPSEREPVVGWIEHGLVATSVMKAVMKGRNRVLIGRPDTLLDLIPVDYVANLCIVAAARCKSSEEVQVYNSCTSGENPLTLKFFLEQIIANSEKHKFYDIPMPSVRITHSRRTAELTKLLLHILPAYIADMFSRGNRRKNMETLNRLSAKCQKTEYFLLNSWVISATRTRELSNSLNPSDRRTFTFDPVDISWEEYIANAYCKGVREYLNKKK